MQTSPPLTFEEFTRRDPTPRYNNLILYFTETGIGPVYRDTNHFKKFKQDHHEIEKNLTTKLATANWEGIDTSQGLKPFDKDIYDAYLIMRNYVESDKDIFS